MATDDRKNGKVNFLYWTPPSRKSVFAAGKGILAWYRAFGEDKCVSFKSVKSKPVVDIRRFQCHLTPEMEAVYDYPTKTGMELSVSEYIQFRKDLPKILEEIRRRENNQPGRDLAFHLGNGRYLSMCKMYNNMSIRKFYALVNEMSGEPRVPTKEESASRFFIELGSKRYLRAGGKCTFIYIDV